MDPAILSATCALVDSLIGGVSTLTASWLTQRGHLRARALVHEAVKRETLYAEFIAEASRCLTDAWSRQAEGAEVITGLYAAVQRMQLTSSDEVIHIAHQVIRLVVEAYAAPNKTFDEARERAGNEDDSDPLREFSAACRVELHAPRAANVAFTGPSSFARHRGTPRIGIVIPGRRELRPTGRRRSG
jgi:hypothetical protein